MPARMFGDARAHSTRVSHGGSTSQTVSEGTTNSGTASGSTADAGASEQTTPVQHTPAQQTPETSTQQPVHYQPPGAAGRARRARQPGRRQLQPQVQLRPKRTENRKALMLTRPLHHLRRKVIAYLAVFLALGAGAGYAVAATKTKTITVCADKTTGVLHLKTPRAVQARARRV